MGSVCTRVQYFLVHTPLPNPNTHLRNTGIGQLTSSQPTTGPRNSVRRRRCAGRSATEMGRKAHSTYRRVRVTYHSLVTVAWESESTSTSNESLGWDLEYRRAGRKGNPKERPEINTCGGSNARACGLSVADTRLRAISIVGPPRPVLHGAVLCRWVG